MEEQRRAELDPPPSLEGRLDALRLSEREWAVLHARAGLDRRFTLGDVAPQLGITRERVRQIQANAVERLRQRLNRTNVAPALDAIEMWLDEHRGDLAARSELLKHARGVLREAGWTGVSERATQRLVIVLRAMCGDGVRSAERSWPRFSLLACLLPPAILAHSKVASELARRDAEERDLSREWTYAELATAVLRAEGGPLHWSEIARRAEAQHRRRQVTPQALFNELLRRQDVFARTGQGTYALAERGYRTVPKWPDLVAAILKEAGKTLSFGEIYQKASTKRAIKESSLQMTLDLHPRFYKSVNGGYGLRAWLLDRNKQTLKTPKHLVEDAESFLRVERGTARGWNVENIVQRDRNA